MIVLWEEKLLKILNRFSSNVGYIINVIYLVYTYDPKGRINIFWGSKGQLKMAIVRIRMMSYVMISISQFSIDCKYIT